MEEQKEEPLRSSGSELHPVVQEALDLSEHVLEEDNKSATDATDKDTIDASATDKRVDKEATKAPAADVGPTMVNGQAAEEANAKILSKLEASPMPPPRLTEVPPMPPPPALRPQQNVATVRPSQPGAIPYGSSSGDDDDEEAPSSSCPLDPAPEDVVAVDIATTARLVMTEEFNAEQLREELHELKTAAQNVPAAVVVDDVLTTSAPKTKRGSGKRGLLVAACVVVLVVVLLVVVVLFIRRNSEDGKDKPDHGAVPSTPSGDNNSAVISVTASTDANSSSSSSTKLLQPTLKTIQERGYIRCRAETWQRDRGKGLSLDLCRALSAAIFNGDGSRTEYPTVPWGEHWLRLHDGTLDVTTAQATMTMQRDVYEQFSKLSVSFSTPWYYSGTQLVGAPEFVDCGDRGDTLTGICKDLVVCSLEASTNNDFIQKHLAGTGIVLVQYTDELFTELAAGNCNVICGQGPMLYEYRAREAGYTGPYVFSSVLHSKEPFTIASRGDDPQWADFTNAILQSLFTAELENIGQDNYTLFPQTNLFGEEFQDMFRNAIKAVGHWGQIYDRNYDLERSAANSLKTNNNNGGGNNASGGLLFSPPFADLEFNPDFKDEVGPGPFPNGTLESVSRRGSLRCGILPNRPGFATADANNIWTGIDVDLCRCFAVALLDDPNKLDFVVLEDSTATYMALAQDMVDVAAGIPYSIQADILEPTTGEGFSFSPHYFYSTIGEALSFVTRQEDTQWTDFVRWTIYALIYAEEKRIGAEDAAEMPLVDLFGPAYELMFRLVVLNFGNYGDLYTKNLEELIPRIGSNLLNDLRSPMLDPLPLGMFQG